MRNERRKQYKNYLRFFMRTFNIRPPYQVICDGNFLHHFVTHNLGDDVNELERLLGTVLDTSEVKAFVVDSAIKELEDLGETKTVKLAKQLESLRVGRDLTESLSFDPPSAIKKLVGFRNRRGFLVATQDDELRNTLRNIPGVPLLFLQRVLIGLEAPSDRSRKFWMDEERRKQQVPKDERKRLLQRQASEKESKPSDVRETDAEGGSQSTKKKLKLTTLEDSLKRKKRKGNRSTERDKLTTSS